MLTQLNITSAKPKAKPYNLSDGHGLVLAIQTRGSKLWRFRYRYSGRQKTLHIGPWPDTSLADAREKCRDARKALANGLDPALEKKRAKVAARFAVATTFKDVALEWIAKCEREGRAEITLDKVRWLLGMAYPLIGSHPINAISPTEALTVLRKVEARGRYESARRMRSILSRVFRYGIATARCDRDVAADLRGALTTPKTVHHAAITNPGDVGVLLKAMDGYNGQTVTRMALRLSPQPNASVPARTGSSQTKDPIALRRFFPKYRHASGSNRTPSRHSLRIERQTWRATTRCSHGSPRSMPMLPTMAGEHSNSNSCIR